MTQKVLFRALASVLGVVFVANLRERLSMKDDGSTKKLHKHPFLIAISMALAIVLGL